MKRKGVFYVFGMIAAIAFIVSSCSLFETSLSGVVSKGPIAQARVTIFELQPDGTRGKELGATVTEADGTYTISVSSAAGPIEVVATGGSYRDEATGETVSLGVADELRTMVSSAAGGATIAVTALTTIAAAQANENASDGLSRAIENANSAVAQAFGLGSGFDIVGVQPADLTVRGTNNNAGKYGAVLAGLSQVVADDDHLQAEDVLALIAAMAKDFEDGKFDDTDAAGNALDTAISLAPKTAIQGLETAINNFLGNGSRNKSNITPGDLNLTIPMP